MFTEHTVHAWLFRPPPAGANVWFDRVECCAGTGDLYASTVLRRFHVGFVTAGALRSRTADSETRAAPGTMFCQWPRLRYRVSAAADAEVRYFRARLRGTAPRSYLSAFGFDTTRTVVRPRDPDGIARVFERLLALYGTFESRDPYHAVCLIYELARAGGRPVHARATEAGAELAEQAATLMEARLHTSVSVASTARALHVSEPTLLRLFRRHFQTTPIRYLTTLRLQRARELLTQTDLKIEAVARACGFRNEKYFYRCFRKRWHETPGQHRRANPPGSTVVEPREQ